MQDLANLPRQAERLFDNLVHWLRTDSLLLVVGVAVVAILYGAFLVLRRWAAGRLAHTPYGGWIWILYKVVASTRSIFALVVAAWLATGLLDGNGAWASIIGFAFIIAMTVQGALWMREFLLQLIERRAQPERDSSGNIRSAFGVLRVLITAVVWSVALVIMLDNLGVNVTALVAGLGIGGIAIGLAAQNIFSDLFAALSILFDQPFRRGDAIQVGGGVSGEVEHIGLKSTRLRAASGEVVILSNNNILSQQINNISKFTHRRVVMTLSVIYQTPPDLLESIPQELKMIVESRPRCEFDRAHFIGFSPSSLDFELVFLLREADFLPMMEERHAIGIAILQRFAALGIHFAYPSQTSFVAGPDGKIVPPPGAIIPSAEG